MKRIYQKIVSWFKKAIKAVTPGENAFAGAAKVLLFVLAILLVVSAIINSINNNDPWLLAFYLGFTALLVLLAMGINWGLKMVMKIPKLFRFALLISFFVLTILFRDNLAYIIIVVSAVLGAALFSLFKTKFKNLTIVQKIISLLGLGGAMTFIVIGIIGYTSNGIEVDPVINAAFTSERVVEHIPLESPAKEGTFKVNTLFYGSGKDKHRKYFGEDVDIKTDSVNGLAFLDNWEGISGWWRTRYWGFDSKALPLNAQVWYPEGDGPFPLVLIVHGNHGMQDYSDPGYEYLGKLLASRGMILASVDENFINSSWSDMISDGLEKENDARGWILLEHLRQWHEWNKTETSPFYQKVDTNKISLIGHSRGGEAVGHAALLNTLPYYSDDASIKLDYQYNIQSIIAIAPVDGQYKPGGTRTKLKDINYFVIHGAQDADVNSFAGNRQFDRIAFTDSIYRFKSGLYIYGANHGQFNTSWGNNDVGTPFTGLLNLKQLLDGEDQREIAKVYISAFLETTLRNDKRYLPLFADVRAGKKWLPETIYLSQFEDSNTNLIATFEEDFDVTTLTQDSIKAMSSKLTVWKEKKIPMKWGSKESRGLFLGWHYDEKDKEEKKKDSLGNHKPFAPVHDSLIASYTLNFDRSMTELDSTSVFVFSMAESKESSNPKSGGKWVSKSSKENNKKEASNSEEEEDKEETQEAKKEDDKAEDDNEKKAKEPIDFSILLKDRNGEEVYFPLSHFSKLQRRIEVELWKLDDNVDAKSENVMQLFAFSIKEMLTINPNFDCTTIAQIHFIFDRTDQGVVVIDNIGFMKDLRTLE
jgi:dienelactone hydrolase